MPTHAIRLHEWGTQFCGRFDVSEGPVENRLGLFEDHGVEAVAGEEAYALVEFYRLLVGFGDRQGEGAEAYGG
jgi:hypothetical protein